MALGENIYVTGVLTFPREATLEHARFSTSSHAQDAPTRKVIHVGLFGDLNWIQVFYVKPSGYLRF